ncbi:MAG: helix-turn-helix domain-containing protein [Clostridium lundense]|nr:helix-turn-helix domain-containing protein [Clostridium lundense]
MSEKLTISVPEAARRLGISKPKAYALARREDFPAFTLEGRILVYAAGLEEWVKAQAENKAERPAV